MVNPAYSLDSSGLIHLAFTVAAHAIRQDGGLSSTTQALSFVQPCSVLQWEQNTLPIKTGRRANEASSVSMPVSIGCPVTGQLVKILGTSPVPSLSGGDLRQDNPALTTKFDIAPARACAG